jgi:hypothetical protein
VPCKNKKSLFHALFSVFISEVGRIQHIADEILKNNMRAAKVKVINEKPFFKILKDIN